MTKYEFDLDPNDAAEWRECLNALTQNDGKRMRVKIEVDENRQRTLLQNAALHKYCELMSQALNDSGMERVKSLQILRQTPEIEIAWTPAAVKEDLWRPVQLALYPNKESTRDLDKPEVSVVYETLNRHTSEKLGVGINFPDRWGG